MTIEKAIKLLHPDTTAEAIAELEYKNGLRGKQAAIQEINEACVVACEAMKKQMLNNKTKELAEYIKTITIREFVKRCRENAYYLEGREALSIEDIEKIAEDEVIL